MDYTMDDEETKRKQEDMAWQQYLESYDYSDFFEDSEDLYEDEIEFKQDSFANPICTPCSSETLTLIRSDESKCYISKCPKCKTTYKTNMESEKC